MMKRTPAILLSVFFVGFYLLLLSCVNESSFRSIEIDTTNESVICSQHVQHNDVPQTFSSTIQLYKSPSQKTSNEQSFPWARKCLLAVAQGFSYIKTPASSFLGAFHGPSIIFPFHYFW